MEKLVAFVHNQLRRGRIRKTVKFYENVIDLYQNSLEQPNQELNNVKSSLTLLLGDMNNLKKRKLERTITDDDYSVKIKGVQRRFLAIVEDDLEQIPEEFGHFVSGDLNFKLIYENPENPELAFNNSNKDKSLMKYVKAAKVPVVLLVVLAVGFIGYNMFIKEGIETTDRPPTIISIFPNDKGGFGQLHYEGISKSVKRFEGRYGRKIKLVQLNLATLDEMKNNNINIILDRLKYYLKEENVIAIHGPPVTESTGSVLNAVYNSDLNIPVFITSAVPKAQVRWNEIRQKVPLFRISTGVDDRAGHIANFIDDLLINHPNKMILLVEQNSGDVTTFGEKFYDEVDIISDNLNDYQNNADEAKNRIEVIRFNRNNLEALAVELEQKGYIYEENVIYLLGVGSQYKFLVDRLYKVDQDKPTPMAQFGGWMNSYAIDKNFKEGEYHLDKLFEITDLAINPTVPMNERQREFLEEFDRKVSPALRDQAFSYDVGYVIYESYNTLCTKYSSELNPNNHLLMNRKLLQELEQLLGSTVFVGASGNIGFDLNKGGINQSGNLQYSRFDRTNNDWTIINYDDIFSDDQN